MARRELFPMISSFCSFNIYSYLPNTNTAPGVPKPKFPDTILPQVLDVSFGQVQGYPVDHLAFKRIQTTYSYVSCVPMWPAL